VRVLWATDHEGVTYALAIGKLGNGYGVRGYRGLEGAPVARMQTVSDSRFAPDAGNPNRDPVVAKFSSHVPGTGLVVVAGRNLTDVELATGFDYTAAGKKTADWQALRPESGVWWAQVDAARIEGVTVRAEFADGKRRPLDEGGVYGQAPPMPGLQEVSPEGTDSEVLNCASMAFDPLRGGFPAGSTPILGGAPKQGREWFGIAVARAPGGGYLIGTCRTRSEEWSNSSGAETSQGFVAPAPAGGPDRFLTVVPVQDGGIPASGDESAGTASKLIAVAPVGATEVEFAGVTAPVHDRVAVVLLPQGTVVDGLKITARDAAGTVLGTAGMPAYEPEVGMTRLNPDTDPDLVYAD
jgi:hypothetical protein